MVRYSRTLSPSLVGRRVVVRYASADGGHTDAVGDLLAWRDGVLTVRTRRGEVRVREVAVVAGKPVPEPRLVCAADVSVPQLQRISNLGWRPLETEWLGGWLLRAGAGFTGRANSVLPLGEPGTAFDEALATVRAWYAGRGLVPRFQLPLPHGAAVDAELAARGWPAGEPVDVLVGDLEPALESLPDRPDLPAVRLDPTPGAGWLDAYHYRGGTLPPEAPAVLANHDTVAFATVADDRGVVAVARGAVDGDWLGVAAVEVAPRARRAGLARHVLRELFGWAAARGARHAHLQVDARNDAAHRMYERMWFTRHHQYRYRQPPEAGQ